MHPSPVHTVPWRPEIGVRFAVSFLLKFALRASVASFQERVVQIIKRRKIPPNNNIINNCRHRDTVATAVVTDTDTAAADDDVDFNIARCHVSRVCALHLRIAVCARSSAHRPRTQTATAASNGFMIFFFRFRLYLSFRFL